MQKNNSEVWRSNSLKGVEAQFDGTWKWIQIKVWTFGGIDSRK